MDSAVWDNESILKIWIWCLLRASYKRRIVTVGIQPVSIQPGQFITGRFKAGEELGMNPNTFWKRIKVLEKLSMVELKSNNKYTLVSVINWASYQVPETDGNNKGTTKEQQSNTNNKGNKGKELYTQVIDHLNLKAGTGYKPTTKATQRAIDARVNEGFTAEDMMRVIDIKADDWKGTEFEKYLRPETLFGSKFEGYLNSRKVETKTEIKFLNIGDDNDTL